MEVITITVTVVLLVAASVVMAAVVAAAAVVEVVEEVEVDVNLIPIILSAVFGNLTAFYPALDAWFGNQAGISIRLLADLRGL